jgi:hypothetical protein
VQRSAASADDLEGDVHFIALRYLDLVLNGGPQEMEKQLHVLHEELSQLGKVTTLFKHQRYFFAFHTYAESFFFKIKY